MRIADYIENNAETILEEAHDFAVTLLPKQVHLDSEALRDHLPQILLGDTLLQVFDNCKLPGLLPGGGLNETACPDSGLFEHGSWYGIRHRTIDLPEPAPGRLDLAALHRSGALTVESTMTWSSPSRPRTRAEGAFDGSTAYWSGAVAAGGPGTLTLGFGKRQRFTRLGLSLRPGHPASARVYVSDDGVSWGEPVATVTDRTDYALRHRDVRPAGQGQARQNRRRGERGMRSRDRRDLRDAQRGRALCQASQKTPDRRLDRA